MTCASWWPRLLGNGTPVHAAAVDGAAAATWTFPDIDPIAFQVGPLAVRWYGLMYLFGFVGGFFVARWLARRRGLKISNEQLTELISYVAVGVVLGGRLGYVIFYNLPYYLAYPLQVFAFWEGGMSFHGGMLGAMLAGWLWVRKQGLPFYPAADCIFAAAPSGLWASAAWATSSTGNYTAARRRCRGAWSSRVPDRCRVIPPSSTRLFSKERCCWLSWRGWERG